MQRTVLVAVVLSLVSYAPGHSQDLPFSPARWAGDLLFVSGQIGNVPGRLEVVEGGVQAQTRQAMTNIRDVLQTHGASMSDVVKCTVMLADISEWSEMNEVYVEFFEPPYPARSAFGASGLAIGARLEIECIAHVPDVVAPQLAAASLENGSFVEQIDGRVIHYAIHGEGPPVMVLTNSWGLTLAGLRGLFGTLEDHATMIYFDPRGMGGSGPAANDEDLSLAAVREDFHSLRRHLGLERVHAIGWSNGATNLVWLAHEHPETLASAIFVHGTPRFSPTDFAAMAARYPALFERFGAAQAELESGELSAEEEERLLRTLYLEEWFPAMLSDPAESRSRLDAAFAEADLSWRHARYAQSEVPVLDQRPLLAQIPVPSLVIAGQHDALPPERAEELATALPRARFVVFDRSGHFAPIEEPHRFLDLVTTFLQLGD